MQTKKYRIILPFILCIISIVLYYNNVTSTNYYKKLQKVETNFSSYEQEGKVLLNTLKSEVHNAAFPQNIVAEEKKHFVHIYKNDSLIYWNTNKIPISQFEELNFPTSGLFKGRNGWYYVQTAREEDYTIAVSFLIRNEYSYQNEYLKNEFVAPFKESYIDHLSLDESAGYPIYDQQKNYLFSIVIDEYQPMTQYEAITLAILIFITIFLGLWIIGRFLNYQSNWVWFYPIALLILRWLSIQYNWFYILNESEIYKASLYGTSSIFPNLFEYFVNVILAFHIVYFVYKKSKNSSLKGNKLISGIILTVPYLTWLGILYLFKGLIENSSIPMNIATLFELNLYSIIALFSMAFLGFSFFIVNKTIALLNIKQALNFKHLLIYNTIAGIVYFIVDYTSINHLVFAAIFPLLFTSLTYLLEYKDFKQKHLLIGIQLLGLYAFTCAITIGEFNTRKDKSNRELYANQLTIERDVHTEFEYNNLEANIREDKYVRRAINSENKIAVREFEDIMERKHFTGFWEKYECSFYLFNNKKQSILNLQDNSNELQNYYDDLISNHGQQSEINQNIYFIKDFTGQYSYIIRQQLLDKNEKNATLYITLKSKKIPEEIGFPRLLLSSKTSSIKNLEKYSLAKYHKNKLVSKYGSFNYPENLSTFKSINTKKETNFDYQKYNHFIYNKTKQDVVVLSGINITWIDIATSFSYLFSIFGILLLPFYIRYYAGSISSKSLTLATKIQISLIGIVFITLITNGVSSGIFVKNQYSEFSTLAFKEKTHSIELQLQPIINKYTALTIQDHGSQLNYQLQSFSKIYNTDINLYDKNGFLVSTSRPNVFNTGLLSEQINAVALKALLDQGQSEFVHTEMIGNLDYNSSYSTLYNRLGQKLGFVNLQHFGQQEEAENQLQQFLVSIINIFVLLLVISTVVAIFTANWITNPLQLLQNFFTDIHLGKTNQRIQYNQNDEIGSLVEKYNEKLEELEQAAQLLALSERESAWRDMAKQVAHEIKNPLTPMKLTVQHLMRSFDASDPNAEERIQKVSVSLIEQIDALTRISNEFSNFAKMPKPSFELVQLTTILQNAIELFRHEIQIEFIQNDTQELHILGDKEQLLRVFNNILKNATQAIPTDRKGRIRIAITSDQLNMTISISDNGSGISEEQKNRLFTPYFTTKSTGSGIGLAMVKQIIENHNGSISFQSEVNIGTTFTIELPLHSK